MLTKEQIKAINDQVDKEAIRSLAYCAESGFVKNRSTGKPLARYPLGRYISVAIPGHSSRLMKEHRLVWFLVHGHWPKEIDHLDGDGTNNRIENLRDVSHGENMRNPVTLKRMSAARGGKGYTLHRGRFRVRIGKRHIGVFDTPEQAIEARNQAIAQYAA